MWVSAYGKWYVAQSKVMVMKSLKRLLSKAIVFTGATIASVSALAANLPPPDVFEPIVDEIDGSHRPIALVASTSLGVYVGIRVWKMVRRAI